MIRLATRIEALERKSGGVNGPARVLCLTGTDTSDAAIDAFLAPYGIDPDHEDTLIIIVRPLVAPEGADQREPVFVPLGFVGGAPDWLKASSAYQERHR